MLTEVQKARGGRADLDERLDEIENSIGAAGGGGASDADIAALRQQIQALSDEILDARSTNSRLDDRLDNIDTAIATANAAIATKATSDALALLQAAVDNIRQEVGIPALGQPESGLLADVTELQRQLTALTGTVNGKVNTADLTALTGRVDAVVNEVTAARGDKDLLVTELNAIKASITAVQDLIGTDSSANSLAARVKTLEDALSPIQRFYADVGGADFPDAWTAAQDSIDIAKTALGKYYEPSGDTLEQAIDKNTAKAAEVEMALAETNDRIGPVDATTTVSDLIADLTDRLQAVEVIHGDDSGRHPETGGSNDDAASAADLRTVQNDLARLQRVIGDDDIPGTVTKLINDIRTELRKIDGMVTTDTFNAAIRRIDADNVRQDLKDIELANDISDAREETVALGTRLEPAREAAERLPTVEAGVTDLKARTQTNETAVQNASNQARRAQDAAAAADKKASDVRKALPASATAIDFLVPGNTPKTYPAQLLVDQITTIAKREADLAADKVKPDPNATANVTADQILAILVQLNGDGRLPVPTQVEQQYARRDHDHSGGAEGDGDDESPSVTLNEETLKKIADDIFKKAQR